MASLTERIAVGDLVQVVRGHECDLGLTFIVRALHQSHVGWACAHCTAVGPKPTTIAINYWKGRCWYGAPLGWLKRIPPLEELEGVKTDEPIKEPV